MKNFFPLCFLFALLAISWAGCSDDNTTTPPTVVPITADLFPLAVGNSFAYTGYATAPGSNGMQIPDPTGSYRTVWTLGPNVPTPLGGTATVIVDTTTGPFGPGGFVVTVGRNLLIQKDSAGDFFFMQTIGPFKRAFGIPVGTTAADTLIWVAVARPTQGVGTTGAVWTAYDSTFTAPGPSPTLVRLEIFGQFEAMETIQDSTGAAPTLAKERVTYRSRTWRRVTLGGTVVQTDATTSELWLAADIGPVQMHIAEDPENPGHFRILDSKNF